MVETHSIISILVWNYPEYIERLLESLQKYSVSQKPYEVYVLDQGSDTATKEVLARLKDSFHLVTLDKNIGFSMGHNYLYNEAKQSYNFKYFCAVNSDILIEQDGWLDILNAALEKNKKNAIAGPSCLKISLKEKNYGDGEIATSPEIQKGTYDTISGAIFSIKNSVIKKIGLFDEVYTPAYFEDTDLNLRCKKNGYRLVYQNINHKHDYLGIKDKVGDRKKLFSEFGDFHSRNKELFIKRWEPYLFMKSRESTFTKILRSFGF